MEDELSDSAFIALVQACRSIPVPSREEQDEIYKTMPKDLAIKETVRRNIPLVINLAQKKKKLQYPYVELEDLVGYGNLGLIRAAELYDYKKSAFSTYATKAIHTYIDRFVMNEQRTIRIPVHIQRHIFQIKNFSSDFAHEFGHFPTIEQIVENTEHSIDEVLFYNSLIPTPAPMTDKYENISSSNSYETIREKEIKKSVKNLLRKLSPREKRYVGLKFGFYDGNSRSYGQIGKELNCTRQNAHLVVKKSLDKLKRSPRIGTIRDLWES